MTLLNRLTLQLQAETYHKLERNARLLGMTTEEYAALLLIRSALALPGTSESPRQKKPES